MQTAASGVRRVLFKYSLRFFQGIIPVPCNQQTPISMIQGECVRNVRWGPCVHDQLLSRRTSGSQLEYTSSPRKVSGWIVCSSISMQAALSAPMIRLRLLVVLNEMRVWNQTASLIFAAGQLRLSQLTDVLQVRVITQEIGLRNGAIC